jgi:hypothetical protein
MSRRPSYQHERQRPRLTMVRFPPGISYHPEALCEPYSGTHFDSADVGALGDPCHGQRTFPVV